LRSFGLKEFSIRVELGFRARKQDDDLELAIIQRFDAHYDLARAAFGLRREFLGCYVEPKEWTLPPELR
jgi:hypothetical protein